MQGARKGGEGVLANEDPPPQPRANVPASIRPGPQRGQLGDTIIFTVISISLRAVPFSVSGTARAGPTPSRIISPCFPYAIPSVWHTWHEKLHLICRYHHQYQLHHFSPYQVAQCSALGCSRFASSVLAKPKCVCSGISRHGARS